MEHPIAALLGTVTGIAVGIVLGAFLVQLATNWLAGFKPKYGTAILAATLGNLASFGIGFVIGIAIENNKGEVTGSVTLWLLVIGFFVLVLHLVTAEHALLRSSRLLWPPSHSERFT